MAWVIDYYNEEVRLEIEALPVGIRASYTRLTELLEEFGLELRMPHSRSMGGGLFELRPRERGYRQSILLYEGGQKNHHAALFL
jgi:hypothetical protein